MADPKVLSAQQEIISAIDAGYPVLYIDTWEEERLEQMLDDASGERPFWRWTATTGFDSGPGSELALHDAEAALNFLRDEGRDAFTLMKDLPAQFQDRPGLRRGIRDVYDAFSGNDGLLVLSYPGSEVPPDLGKEMHVMHLPLPDGDELFDMLMAENGELESAKQLDETLLQDAALRMRGISSNEARDLFRRLIKAGIRDKEAATQLIIKVKGQLMMKENCLEVIPTPLDLDQVGGLHSLKKWIVSRHRLFGAKAREAGIKAPSGLLLMGVSGCGKSLAAKVLPAAWKLPLIRLDMNLIMSGAWGSAEAAWERALRAAETAAPIVLWIDEIENSFGYMNGQVTSGNMTIFSSFLTWMQEKPEGVFVVATANKIEMLPAEMLRKGRFDQLFFLDLPKEEARREILRIHINNQGGDAETLDLDHLAELVDGWTAAEIEQMVRSARLDAFYEDRAFDYDDLMRNSFRMVPLSKTMAEQIQALRAWSRKRATPAD